MFGKMDKPSGIRVLTLTLTLELVSITMLWVTKQPNWQSPEYGLRLSGCTLILGVTHTTF